MNKFEPALTREYLFFVSLNICEQASGDHGLNFAILSNYRIKKIAKYTDLIKFYSPEIYSHSRYNFKKFSIRIRISDLTKNQ